MTPNHLDSLGRVPKDWHFESERAAIAFYGGDAVKASTLEITPEWDPVFYSSVCDLVSRFELLADAVGMVPDLLAARNVTRLSTTAVSLVLQISHSRILDWDSGRRPLPAAVAVSLCEALRWPLAMLFRSRAGWHPRTKLAMEGGDSGLRS